MAERPFHEICCLGQSHDDENEETNVDENEIFVGLGSYRTVFSQGE